MKIIEQTASRMVLQQKPSMVLFMVLWGSLFAGIPLVMIGILAARAGVTQLSCHRVAPSQVISQATHQATHQTTGPTTRSISCQTTQSHFFGIVAGQDLTISQVTAAQLITKTISTEDGDTEVYGIQLLSSEETANLTRFDANQLMKQSWVNQINQFVASNRNELKLSSDTRWSFETISMILFSSLFVLIGTSVLHSTLRTRTLILDKALNRLSYKVQTLTGSQQLDYPLGIVSGVQLKEHTDSYGNKFYEPILLPDAVRSITFAQTNRQTALQLQEQVSQFLKLPVLPSTSAENADNVENSEPTVYQFQGHTYTTTGLEAVPETASIKTKEVDAQLRQLGFTFVGELESSDFPRATLYTYAQTYRDVSALIVETKTGYFGVEFLTSFLDGLLLNTTSNRLVVKHFKPQKLKRWSYPNLDVTQLYQQHLQHCIELQQTRQMYRVRADLSAVGALADDYFTRQVTGKFAVLATVFNLFAAASANQNKPAQ